VPDPNSRTEGHSNLKFGMAGGKPDAVTPLRGQKVKGQGF